MYESLQGLRWSIPQFNYPHETVCKMSAWNKLHSAPVEPILLEETGLTRSKEQLEMTGGTWLYQ